MKAALSFVVVLLLSSMLLAQSGPASPEPPPAEQAQPGVSSSADTKTLQETLTTLQEQINRQQQEIEALREKLVQQGTPHITDASLHMVPAAAAAVPAPQGEAKKPDGIELANGKIKINAVVYGDWGMYYDNGFGPQFLTQTNYPGPGNDNYNAFDITRTYLNFLFIPNKHLTIRLTPNIYRQIGKVSADSFGKVGAIGPSVDGNLTVRMKYAYAEFNHLFDGAPAIAEDNIRLGMQMNPLVDWEEGLYGYRFVNLTPWNFLSLSSTQVGVSINGPIKWNGKQYLDWQVGAFDDANFHQFEQSSRKQVMARLSVFPMGASSKYQGLGFTGFIDYGFSNSTPDSVSTPLYRIALLGHYTSQNNGGSLAFEYDLGRNAFGSGNLFSGGAPADEFGLAVTPFADMDALAKALLNGRATKQEGFDVFGHVNIPNSKFSLFGMYQYFLPNTEVSKNPYDFHRVVAGVAYKYNSHLRFAFDSQNIIWAHDQFVFPASEIALFSPALAAAHPLGINNPVPPDTKAFFVNMELTF